MTVIDYNASGYWSADEILKRYQRYARQHRITEPFDLSPLVHSAEGKRWIYPVMDRVVDCIEKGDLACADIGVEFIEESGSFAFGRILKSNVARALRRASLTEAQKERIRRRVVAMLCAGYLPREFRQYAKLARKIGLGNWLTQIEREANLEEPWVRRYYEYFKENAS